MKMSARVSQALKDVGAVLKRQKKHRVYELPSGQNIVVANSPSDVHAEQNALREIHRIAGVEKPEKPEPKPKRHKPGRQESGGWSLPPLPRAMNPLTSQLKAAVEQQLRDDNAGLRAENDALEKKFATLVHEHAALADDWAELAVTLDALRHSRWVRLGRFLRVVSL